MDVHSAIVGQHQVHVQIREHDARLPGNGRKTSAVAISRYAWVALFDHRYVCMSHFA